MTEVSVVFVGLARDCEVSAAAFVEALAGLSAQGGRVSAVIGENGSTDRTREILTRSPLVRVVDTGAMTDAGPRLRRMAVGRQLLQKAVANEPANLVAVIDIDERFLDDVTLEQIDDAAARLATGEVYAVGATSRPAYYDLLAYRGPEGDFAGLDRRIDEQRRRPLRYYRLFREEIYPAQRRLTRHEDMMCRSSFNGLAFYRAEDFRLGSYLSEAYDECEHVPFHASLASATGRGAMVIAGTLILRMPREHGPRGVFGFFWQRIVRQTKQRFL
ncbi:MAG TPA: hypothetical protein VGE38_05460 [Nocardioides sp.]|uniref:hypothetical protein n=1 Tax=Nocardioides sp. TaxID=35761 RepID=UPI002EDA8DDA